MNIHSHSSTAAADKVAQTCENRDDDATKQVYFCPLTHNVLQYTHTAYYSRLVVYALACSAISRAHNIGAVCNELAMLKAQHTRQAEAKQQPDYGGGSGGCSGEGPETRRQTTHQQTHTHTTDNNPDVRRRGKSDAFVVASQSTLTHTHNHPHPPTHFVRAAQDTNNKHMWGANETEAHNTAVVRTRR